MPRSCRISDVLWVARRGLPPVERHWKPADLVQRTVSTLHAALTRPPGQTT